MSVNIAETVKKIVAELIRTVKDAIDYITSRLAA